ncbi:conserved hypothetical protein [Candidatus Methylobacter favarea]|uniref:Uncharacterized protein n=1 Tax=Candidatus Methylobacter favarea TaxID=2707345 RepID=A0A8S0WKC3_9GAMM|nr:hypothetical protein [Candidatus Methylobacter favarea]CAA9891868.1 conserved hypothetical protein [Candidatus Methylobacter favarea]
MLDDADLYLLIPLFLTVAAMMKWIHWYFKTPPSPLFVSFIAIIAVLYFTVKILRVKKRILTLRQGREGEKAVGQYLERLRENVSKYFTILLPKVLIWIM